MKHFELQDFFPSSFLERSWLALIFLFSIAAVFLLRVETPNNIKAIVLLTIPSLIGFYVLTKRKRSNLGLLMCVLPPGLYFLLTEFGGW